MVRWDKCAKPVLYSRSWRIKLPKFGDKSFDNRIFRYDQKQNLIFSIGTTYGKNILTKNSKLKNFYSFALYLKKKWKCFSHTHVLS